MGLLSSVLRMNGLILVDTDEADWKRVAADEDLMLYCTLVDPETSRNEMTVVSQILELKHINTRHAYHIIKPFLSKPGGNLIAIENLNMIILTDYAKNIDRILKVLHMADQPQTKAELAFIEIKHLDVAQMATQLTKLLSAQMRYETTLDSETKPLEILSDERTNQLILIGRREAMADAKDLIRSFRVTAYKIP
jgi:type II secretory pathway component GspD/PulD (secretin)